MADSSPTASTYTEGKEDKKMFLTMTDLMWRLNENLSEMDLPNDKISPRVELQKRLPDGSTRPADESDLAAVDLQTKIKQAAAFVSQLESREQKLQWAELQRLEGNKLYAKGDYREAMDVYLTCLVAKPDDADDKAFSRQVLFRCLNNLGLCSLQLQMYSKTDQFCTLALEEAENVGESDEERDSIAKVYFRRGKSRRLQGLYEEARNDLEKALKLLGEKDEQERRAVQREMQKLDKSELEAKRNEKRQERALKRALGNSNAQDVADCCTNHNASQRRKFSTLTVKQKPEDVEDEDSDVQLSCWQHYLLVVVRLTERALVLLGDEETIDRIERRNGKTEKDD